MMVMLCLYYIIVLKILMKRSDRWEGGLGFLSWCGCYYISLYLMLMWDDIPCGDIDIGIILNFNISFHMWWYESRVGIDDMCIIVVRCGILCGD